MYVHEDGTYDLNYESGETELEVPRRFIRRSNVGSAKPSLSSPKRMVVRPSYTRARPTRTLFFNVPPSHCHTQPHTNVRRYPRYQIATPMTKKTAHVVQNVAEQNLIAPN